MTKATSALALALACGAAMAQSPVPPTAPVSSRKPERRMTAAEGKALLDSVDTVMAFDAADTGLKPVEHVRRRLVGRDEVTRYLARSFDEDESAKRLQRSEIVLKKFGLLSRDFDLRPFLLRLLTEQIAGYYDEKTKTVNLLDWVPPAAQQPVLAHELTHAIQDQRVGLEHWSNSGFKGVSKDVGEDNARVRTDETETARQAVAEGQAMLVFVDYGTKLREAGKQPDGDDLGAQDVMTNAPLLLQKSLEFPYLAGMAFERAVLAHGGKQAAFAGTLDTPPTTSYEILHPEAYLAHAPMPVLRLPDLHSVLDAQWEPYDVGVMGSLDVDIMASLYGSPEMAASLAPAWDGGVYYAAQRRNATAAEKRTQGSIGLVYYSQWKSNDAAEAFARLYATELGHKSSGVKERTDDEVPGDQVFTTAEGDVLIARTGSNLFISDGYPLAVARLLESATAAVQGTGPMQRASVPAGELGLRLGGLARPRVLAILHKGI